MTTRLTLAYSAPTDKATIAWEKARPNGNPPLSPAYRALVETADIARGGGDALIEALQEALEAKYSWEDRDELAADVEALTKERDDLIEEWGDLDRKRDELLAELDALRDNELDALRSKIDTIVRLLEK